MNILLLSAYDTLSHQKWRQQLVTGLPEFSWQVLTLPPRYFNYRVRTSALSWFYQHKEKLEQRYDLIIATSVTDITLLKSLNSSLSNTPVWLFCHENQFEYPESAHEKKEHRLQLQTSFFFNCLCADWISFNSHWNRDTALKGLETLRRSWPERLPAEAVDSIRNKSDVLHVPLANHQQPAENSAENSGQINIVWNHRWEYDKGPDALLHFVKALASFPEDAIKKNLRLHIVGQQFRQMPDAFKKIKQLFEGSAKTNSNVTLGQWGYIEDHDQYQTLLASSDIVLSTSLHDFQGLSVLEAVQNGCVPLLPNALVYPEFFSAEFLYDKDQENDAWHEAAIKKLLDWISSELPETPCVKAFHTEQLLPRYRKQIFDLTSTTA